MAREGTEAADQRLYAPAVARNREPLLAVLHSLWAFDLLTASLS